jgi:hypothetical protein
MLTLDRRWMDALWRSPYRLRFELSAGGNYVSMFTRSYDRARQLARAALTTDRPLAVVVDYASPCWAQVDENEVSSTTSFGLLQEMGVSTDGAEATWNGHFYPGDENDVEASTCEHRAIGVSWDEADILLWNNIAQEIGVRPRAPVLSKLADRATGVVVNAYDDRGMDIIALSARPIEHLYGQFDAWLLDYDRARMAEVFGSRAR